MMCREPLNWMLRVSKVIDRNITHNRLGAAMMTTGTLTMIGSDNDIVTLFLPTWNKVTKDCINVVTIFVYLNGIKTVIMT